MTTDKVRCSEAAADLLMSMLQARHLCMTDSCPLTCWKAVVKSVDGTLRSLLPGVTPDPVFEPTGAVNQVTTSSPYPEIRIGTRGSHACLNAADCFLNYGTKRTRTSYSPATSRTTMMWLRYDLGNPCHVLMEVTFPAGTYHVNAQGSVVGSEFRVQRVLSHDETVKEVLAQAPGSQFAVIADKTLLLKRFHQNPVTILFVCMTSGLVLKSTPHGGLCCTAGPRSHPHPDVGRLSSEKSSRPCSRMDIW